MRHLKRGRKFHRKKGQRRAFLRNLVNDFIKAGKIETTEARAKSVRPIVERLVTIAKRGTLASRRLILSRVRSKIVAEKLMRDLGARYAERAGGYTRITKLGKSRKRDGSYLVTLEFI